MECYILRATDLSTTFTTTRVTQDQRHEMFQQGPSIRNEAMDRFDFIVREALLRLDTQYASKFIRRKSRFYPCG